MGAALLFFPSDFLCVFLFVFSLLFGGFLGFLFGSGCWAPCCFFSVGLFVCVFVCVFFSFWAILGSFLALGAGRRALRGRSGGQLATPPECIMLLVGIFRSRFELCVVV